MNTFDFWGSIGHPRKSVPRIPARLSTNLKREGRDFVRLWPNAHSVDEVGHGAAVFYAINRLPSRCSPHLSPHTGGQWRNPILCTLFAAEKTGLADATRRCISSSMSGPEPEPRDLSSRSCGLNVYRLPAGTRNTSTGRERIYEGCNSTLLFGERDWPGVYCSLEINPLTPIDVACFSCVIYFRRMRGTVTTQ